MVDDLRIAVREGADAYVNGVALGDCPYADRRSASYKQWRESWLKANAADPLLDDDERETINS
jgi:hypothetical protein